jgi:hypothetical protein
MQTFVSRIKRIPRLDAAADSLDQLAKRIGAVEWADKGQQLLGHPAHPALTDLPIGFWTSAWVLDTLGGRKAIPAARFLLGLGVLSAVPTAAVGLGDATYLKGRTRRVAMIHAASNTTALTFALMSLLTSRRHHRLKAVTLNWLAGAAATVGGYLGGVLTFDSADSDAESVGL